MVVYDIRPAAAEPLLAKGPPVTGNVDAAIRGDMLMFVGGDDAVVETVRLVIEAMVTAKLAVCKLIEDDAGIDLRVPGDWVKLWEVKHG